mmetsp:Transcript_72367/g.169564  ORF Transcript_72367/g.169564 Transcript_72367/m.169564 type:complete len:254 (-) Transcript_72367:92-853(-)
MGPGSPGDLLIGDTSDSLEAAPAATLAARSFTESSEIRRRSSSFSASVSSSSLSIMCRSHTQAPNLLRALMTLRSSWCSLFKACFSASGLCAACMDRSCSCNSSTRTSSACLSSSHRSLSACTKATMESTDVWPFFAAASAAKFSPTSNASARQFIEDASLFFPIEDVSLPALFGASSSSASSSLSPGLSRALSCSSPSNVMRVVLRLEISLPSLREGRKETDVSESLATSLAAALTTVEVAGVSPSSKWDTK